MRDFKTRLKGVLKEAVANFQSSGDPNDACVKAANSAEFNEDQADRLVETFNTARVICNYKSADDKTSSCSLADKEVVRAGLAQRGPCKKSAEAKADYSCYLSDETDHFVHARKEAEFVLKEADVSKNTKDYLALRRYRVECQLAKTAEEEAGVARSTADVILKKVAGSLSRNASIGDVHDKVARIVCAYALDGRYAPAVEKLAAFLPPSSDPPRAVLDRYASMEVFDTSDIDEHVPEIKEASDLLAEAAALDAYSLDLQSSSVLGKAAAAPEKPSSGGLDFVLPAFNGSVGGLSSSLLRTATDEMNRKAKEDFDDAGDAISNLRRQLILQELLVRDPILSREDPISVVNAFKAVTQISPHSSLNKEITRSMLRSMVKSVAISPFDAKALADVDKTRGQAYGYVSNSYS